MPHSGIGDNMKKLRYTAPAVVTVDDDKLYDETKAANVLDVPGATLASWRRQGIGPHYRKAPNGYVRYLGADLRAFIKGARPKRALIMADDNYKPLPPTTGVVSPQVLEINSEIKGEPRPLPTDWLRARDAVLYKGDNGNFYLGARDDAEKREKYEHWADLVPEVSAVLFPDVSVLACLFRLALSLIIQHDREPKKVHEAFLKIAEYRANFEHSLVIGPYEGKK